MATGGFAEDTLTIFGATTGATVTFALAVLTLTVAGAGAGAGVGDFALELACTGAGVGDFAWAVLVAETLVEVSA